ncbi:[Fructose-bisphosphate aldolase]-lysine N-methyltransferase, chloroplastic [Linum perenne]
MAAFFTISTSFLSPSVTKPNYASIRATAALQSPTTAKAPPPSVATFWEWLTEKGVVSGKTPVRPGVVTEGLGLVAKRDIGRNEVVLEVPKKFWINPKSVEGSEIGRICGGLKPWISVALFLIREKLKGDGSDWKKEFQRVEQDILKPHKQMFPSNVTLEDFTWAFGILRSRAFSRLRGEDLVLIPLIKGAGLFSRDLLFSLRSPVSVKAGEQVMLSPGSNYGFVESKPDRNVYTLTLQISEEDQFVGDKLDVAETNGMGETFDIILGYPLPTKLLPYLRLVALGGTDAFLLESIFRNTIWDHLQLPISRANEELICRVVRDACKSALSGFHTTIEEVRFLAQVLL